jgi:hypothetical protein
LAGLASTGKVERIAAIGRGEGLVRPLPRRRAGRDHSLVIDERWHEVCDASIDFVGRFAPVTG